MCLKQMPVAVPWSLGQTYRNTIGPTSNIFILTAPRNYSILAKNSVNIFSHNIDTMWAFFAYFKYEISI